VEATLKKLADYVKETLGVAVAHSPWRHAHLPHFIKETYKFSEAKILGARCLLMLDSGKAERAPAALRKHIDLVQPKWDGEIIYVRPRLTAYNRKRLVEQKVPFIVPGNQMYLPMLAIDFREHFRRLHEEQQTLSPSAQVLMIHLLLNVGEGVLTPKEAAARLGYSAMSMTRAFNELEAAQLVEVYTRGRERQLSLVARPRDTWTKALAFFRSPVKKQLCIQRIGAASRGQRAGLTALAEYTMLAPPARVTCALHGKDWLSLRQQHTVVEVPQQDPDALEIEVWSYAPAHLADGDLVDPLSLYLSLRDSDDERVAASLEELMEKVKW